MSSITISPRPAKLKNHSPSVNLFSTLHAPGVTRDDPNQFTPAVVHEIRNPLSNINLAVEMLNSMIADECQKLYLDIIMRGSVRINNIVSDLLAPVQVEQAPLEKHSVHQLLDEVISLTEDRITLKKITITRDYAPEDYKLLLNRPKMKIALTNIIINAVDAMPPENGQLRLATRSEDDNCVIEIEDNGTGISKENLKTIFKPYFTNKPGGMGLGLSTTLDILLSNHAGTNVQSEEGRGTCFIISFDRTAAEETFLHSKPVW